MDSSPDEMGLFYLFTYLISFISGIIVYFTLGKNNQRLKFHAIQSIFLGIIILIIDYGLAFIPYVQIIPLLLWIYGMYIGYQGFQNNDVVIPVLGEYAKKYAMQ